MFPEPLCALDVGYFFWMDRRGQRQRGGPNRAAADLGENMDKNAVTLGAVPPAREMLAEVLYLQNHPKMLWRNARPRWRSYQTASTLCSAEPPPSRALLRC